MSDSDLMTAVKGSAARRTAVVMVRCTNEEKAQVEAAAREAGTTVAAVARLGMLHAAKLVLGGNGDGAHLHREEGRDSRHLP